MKLFGGPWLAAGASVKAGANPHGIEHRHHPDSASYSIGTIARPPNFVPAAAANPPAPIAAAVEALNSVSPRIGVWGFSRCGKVSAEVSQPRPS